MPSLSAELNTHIVNLRTWMLAARKEVGIP